MPLKKLQVMNTKNVKSEYKMETIAKFSFRVKPEEDDMGDTIFNILLGERDYTSCLTGWSNNFAVISADIERLISDGCAMIKLDFDTEPVEISARRQGENVDLTITASYFQLAKPMYGLVPMKDFIRSLYDGLLFATTFCYDDVGCGWNWHLCKMVNYNMMKSRFVESFLRGETLQNIQNYAVKHVLVYDGEEILHICDETIGYHIPLNDRMEIRDKEANILATIDGNLLRSEEFLKVANSLPGDFDFWICGKNEEFYTPKRVSRRDVSTDMVFLKRKEEYDELGADPYGFTAKTLWDACNELDSYRIMHYLDLGADTTYLLYWILKSNKGGTTDEVGNPTYQEGKDAIMARDAQKAGLIREIFVRFPKLEISEDHLKYCYWYHSYECMKTLLELGTNPNEQKISNYAGMRVKYRSVLNLVNTNEGKDKYGIFALMKQLLLSYGAKNVLILNEEFEQSTDE